MHFFYVHLPWSINQEEYNCSTRTHSEWQSTGSVNVIQGWYFAIVGTSLAFEDTATLEILYAMCLYGMYRGSLLKIPCYKLMFFNGIIDIVELMVTFNMMAFFHFTGAVFCSSMVLSWIMGHLGYSLWLGSSFNCVVLAFNRFVEMIPSAKAFRFLFRGKTVYVWVLLSLLYIAATWFIFRPLIFNTVVSACVATPMIRDYEWEYTHFTSSQLIIHNCTVLTVLLTTYPILCYHVWKTRAAAGCVENFRIFMQVLFVCLATGTATLLYILLTLLSVPRNIVVGTHVFWQLSHGIHGVVYLCFNKRVRGEVVGIFVKSYRNNLSTETVVSTLKTRNSTTSRS